MRRVEYEVTLRLIVEPFEEGGEVSYVPCEDVKREVDAALTANLLGMGGGVVTVVVDEVRG